jgi:hypothetical protein
LNIVSKIIANRGSQPLRQCINRGECRPFYPT